MTVPAISPFGNNDQPASTYWPDRRILSRREFEALSVIVDIMTADNPADAVREMECTESHVFGSFRIDVHYRRVLRGHLPVHVTPREYDLLMALARRGGAPASTQDLIDEVWKGDLKPGSRTLSQHVHALRRKLELDPSAPRYITTVSKFGYRLQGESRSVSTGLPSDSQR